MHIFENDFTRRRGDIISKIIIIIAALCMLASIAAIGYLLMHADQLEKIWKIMIHNINFWILMVTGCAYGVWRKISNPDEFVWFELVAQLLIGIIVTVGLFGAFSFRFSGVYDTEFLNGYVEASEYYEEWTEEVEREVCDSEDEDGDCTSSHIEYDEVYHPPEWKASLSVGSSIPISKEAYQKYVSKFGNEKEISLFRMDQISIGDGDKYVSVWKRETERIVPASINHNYVNYFKASKDIFKREGLKDPYQKLLLNYPGLQTGPYGHIEVNRVLAVNANVPDDWKKAVDRNLDVALTRLGSSKQVNILVYMVSKTDRGFLHALEEHWVYGKKNDVIVVVSVDKFPEVLWSGVVIFFGNDKLKIELRDSIETTGISDPNEFTNLIISHINNSFRRVPMAELEYMLYDIELPWWVIAIVFFLDCAVVMTASFLFENNDTRNFNFRGRMYR